MTELELTRTRGDRRLYALEGIGTLRLDGTFARSATAEAGRDTWRFTQRGFWRRVISGHRRGGNRSGRVPAPRHPPRRHAPLGPTRTHPAADQPLTRALHTHRRRSRLGPHRRQKLGPPAGQSHSLRLRRNRARAAALRHVRRSPAGRQRSEQLVGKHNRHHVRLGLLLRLTGRCAPARCLQTYGLGSAANRQDHTIPFRLSAHDIKRSRVSFISAIRTPRRRSVLGQQKGSKRRNRACAIVHESARKDRSPRE